MIWNEVSHEEIQARIPDGFRPGDAAGMGIQYKIRKAEEVLGALSDSERQRVGDLCRQIRKEQLALQQAGRALFARCISGCEGLCCKNVIADELITFRDFFFILATASLRAADLLPLAEEEPLFTADCMFLKTALMCMKKLI